MGERHGRSLSGALGLLKRVALLVGGNAWDSGHYVALLPVPRHNADQQVDELLIVVLLLYPVTSWRSPSGRDRIQRITNDLRKAFEEFCLCRSH